MARSQKTVTYTIDEVAKLLGIGRNNAYEAARSGQIPSIRIGKRLLVPRTAFEHMLAGTAPDPQSQAPSIGSKAA